MTQYNVTGMTCSACSARVEKAVNSVDGVTSCSVSLLTNSMGVDGTAKPTDIINAVKKAGYGASLKGKEKGKTDDSSLNNNDIKGLKNRLIYSVIVLLVLMYFSMGHMMFGFPLPAILENNHIAMGLIQLILTAIIMVINQRFYISGFKGLIHKAPNMDSLVALGSGAAFVYSTYALFAMTTAQLNGDSTAVMEYMNEMYFESAGTILTLITVGKTLESYSKGKTTDALKSLMKLSPKTACLIKDGEETVVSVEDVNVGDIFVVRAGENIPVDAVVVEGETSIDESALTGESIPVDKSVGDNVSAGTVNQWGFIKCKAVRVGEDTTLSQIIKMVSDASATKAPIAKVADKVSGVFVPTVIAIAIVTTIVWLLLGKDVGFALARGISVLVISCPCALGLATPVAIMVGNGIGAKNGILFKTAVSLEQTGKTQIVALDKTGTITEGKPKVTDVINVNADSDEQLLKLAYSIEVKSEHPLASAVCEKSKELGLQPQDITDFKVLAGNGLQGKLDGKEIIGGSYDFVKQIVDMPIDVEENYNLLAQQGKTPLLFAYDGKLLGIIAVADTIKADSPQAIEQLKNMGIRVVMLTGDNKKTANAIGTLAGVDDVVAGVLPDGKEKVVTQLMQYGKVAMVGDGINDAPALTRADIGIAIGAGTDVAIDAGDVVLMNSKLTDVASAIRLSRRTLVNIHENLFWAFIYNVIGIPLATGAFISLLGWKLNPMFAAAAMSLSSFCVVSNALRLNLFNIHNAKKDKKIKPVNFNLKEINNMTKTIKIEGMMCSHCEATVKKTLEALPQVESADVSHEKGTAVVTLSQDVADEVLKNAVEEQGYKVL